MEHEIIERDFIEDSQKTVCRSVYIGNQLRSRRISANSGGVRHIQSYYRRLSKDSKHKS